MNVKWLFVAVFLVLASRVAAGESSSGSSKAGPPKAGPRKVLKASQLRRVGGWRVPPYVQRDNSTAWSEGGIDIYDGHLWLSHHAHFEAVAKFKIPAEMGTGNDIAKWPQLNGVDFIESKWNVVGGAKTMGIQQLDASTLLVSARSGYAAPPEDKAWLQRFDLKNRKWLPTLKPENTTIQHHAGGFCRIPQWFADKHFGGRTVGLCAGGYESGQESSMGPALAAVSPTSLTDGLLLMSYPWNSDKTRRERRPADYQKGGLGWAIEPDGKIGYWSVERHDGGGAWIDTGKYHGLVYFIRQGRGRLDYKLQTECFAKEHLSRVYIYDPADLAKVAAGKLKPHAVRGTCTDWAEPGKARGATWDGRRLYVFQGGTWNPDGENFPSIHVFEVIDADQ